jgi:hypothetical protein
LVLELLLEVVSEPEMPTIEAPMLSEMADEVDEPASAAGLKVAAASARLAKATEVLTMRAPDGGGGVLEGGVCLQSG